MYLLIDWFVILFGWKTLHPEKVLYFYVFDSQVLKSEEILTINGRPTVLTHDMFCYSVAVPMISMITQQIYLMWEHFYLLSALLHVHELTDTCDWLVAMCTTWMPLPPRQHGRFFFLGVRPYGCGVTGIRTGDLLVIGQTLLWHENTNAVV